MSSLVQIRLCMCDLEPNICKHQVIEIHQFATPTRFGHQPVVSEGCSTTSSCYSRNSWTDNLHPEIQSSPYMSPTELYSKLEMVDNLVSCPALEHIDTRNVKSKSQCSFWKMVTLPIETQSSQIVTGLVSFSVRDC